MVILEKKIKEIADVKVELVNGKVSLTIVADSLLALDGLKDKIDGSIDDAIIDIAKLVIKNLEK